MRKFKIVNDIKRILKPTWDFSKQTNTKLIVGLAVGAYAIAIIPLVLSILSLGVSFMFDLLNSSFDGYGLSWGLGVLNYQLSNSVVALIFMLIASLGFAVVGIFSSVILPYATLSTLYDIKAGRIERITFKNLKERFFSSKTGFISIWSYIGKSILYLSLPCIGFLLVFVIIDLLPFANILDSFLITVVCLYLMYNLQVRCFLENKEDAKSFVNENYLVPVTIILLAAVAETFIASAIVIFLAELFLACYVVNTLVEKEPIVEQDLKEIKEVTDENSISTIKVVEEKEEVKDETTNELHNESIDKNDNENVTE